ncbi:MAG: serine hydrolase [Alphaproteobacteria bacterium]|nr:serine hydrolase [Alphaproteobacteria bacterium]
MLAMALGALLFQGRLVLDSQPAGFTVVKDPYGFASLPAARTLPPFDFEFVQSGRALIPIRRGAVPGSHPLWEFILEPGRVRDDTDGFARAELPFALEERNQNCMHQGTLAFRFRADGAVADAHVDIAAETCAYFQFDMQGDVAAHYVPGAVEGAAGAIKAYRREEATRLPQKTFAALQRKYPDIDASAFGSEVAPGDMSLYGLVLDGTNYVGGCRTRDGAYPFCAQMDLPSFSVAKSVFASMMTMRLAHLYWTAPRQRIAPYVPQCAQAGTWGDVTFAETLDMATGNYLSSQFEADENSPDMGAFLQSDTHDGKIGFSCAHYPRQAQPGTTWVYHTADTYTLGTALRAFHAAKAGADRDFVDDLLVQPIWRPLHLHPGLGVVRRTYDATAEPFAGYGLTLTADDVAKLSIFLNDDHGMLGRRAVLDQTMLSAALQQLPGDGGLVAGEADLRYHYGFWAWNAQGTLGCIEPAWIPFMSGYGGIVVALLPNGMTYYYFSDGNSFAWSRAVAEADKMRPFCKR